MKAITFNGDEIIVVDDMIGFVPANGRGGNTIIISGGKP